MLQSLKISRKRPKNVFVRGHSYIAFNGLKKPRGVLEYGWIPSNLELRNIIHIYIGMGPGSTVSVLYEL